MTRRSKGFWLALAVAVILLWTFLPMYWTVKYAFMTKTKNLWISASLLSTSADVRVLL